MFLHTDASNYGIGGYLYQVIDDARVPIQFVSRKLNKRELKWNTVEKEAKSFVTFTGIDHQPIHPYSHEENGMVERANYEVPIKYTWDKNHRNYEPPIKRSRSS